MRVMVSSKKEDIRLALLAGRGLLYARKVHETHKTKSGFMRSVLLEAAASVAGEIGAEIDLRAAARPPGAP